MIENDELIQYFIVNKDLNMSVGKMVSQVTHLAERITEEIIENKNINREKYKLYKKWKNEYIEKMVTLKGSAKDLIKLKNNNCYFFEDAGLTEIQEGSLTVVGTGIVWKSEVQILVKRLQCL